MLRVIQALGMDPMYMSASAKVATEKADGLLKTMMNGLSGKKVKSKKQAIAIGLSEARRSGAKVPKRKKKSS